METFLAIFLSSSVGYGFWRFLYEYEWKMIVIFFESFLPFYILGLAKSVIWCHWDNLKIKNMLSLGKSNRNWRNMWRKKYAILVCFLNIFILWILCFDIIIKRESLQQGIEKMYNPFQPYINPMMFYNFPFSHHAFNYQLISNQTKISSNFVLVENKNNQPKAQFQDEKSQ